YCLESLSAGEVAHRCNCSKALVIERLAQLRRVLGRNPAELRPYSTHFEQMDRSLSDSRARKIDRAHVLE
ncbi:MAG TPA: hypothetical protein VN673_13405, partial [Clostridia bacterium]|nr:hypothetical protein [Clostridia bacterium]